MPLQLSCSETYQIWAWYSMCNRCRKRKAGNWLSNPIAAVVAECWHLNWGYLNRIDAPNGLGHHDGFTWRRHQMEAFSAALAICAGNSLVIGEFSSKRPVMRSFDVFFDLRLNKRLSRPSSCRWFETPSRSLWRHCNEMPAPYRTQRAHNAIITSSLRQNDVVLT